ncbi:serine/threonine-protein kinase [Nocardia sp. NPDC088792]|uniref:serine/threonine-protein kinase n=1 Tax=Nocardia sp. NPDC088792 TaxID=3364332 RepID=UPI0038071584
MIDASGKGAHVVAGLVPGSEFAGFIIERHIGSGGMGSVYLARDPKLGRRVALKVIKGEAAESDTERLRFDREARLTANLDHSNIVPVYTAGNRAGAQWIAMRYIDGSDVGSLVPATGMDLRQALRIIAQIADALDYAHRRGVIHRDVKPGNILLQLQTQSAYLTDFGIAGGGSASTRLTATGMVLASFHYGSPEQLRAAPTDRRSDQYSLACTLFHMLTGRAPFEGSQFPALVLQHCNGPRPLVSRYRPELSPLDPVIMRAMSIDPAARYSSCLDFAQAAIAVVSEKTIADRPASQQTERPVSYHRPYRPMPPAPPTSWRPPRRQRITAAGTITFVKIVVVGALLLSCFSGCGQLVTGAAKLWTGDGSPEQACGGRSAKKAADLSESGPRPIRLHEQKSNGYPEYTGVTTTIADGADPAVWSPSTDGTVQLMGCVTGIDDGTDIRSIQCPDGIPIDLRQGIVKIEVREARTGRLIKELQLPGETFPIDISGDEALEVCTTQRKAMDPLDRDTALGRPTADQIRTALDVYVNGPKP